MSTAGQRMVTLLGALSLRRQQARAVEIYALLQEGAKAGRFGSLTADEVVNRFAQNLVMAKDADAALNALCTGTSGGTPAGPSTIEKSEDDVIIAGIRVPRSKV